MVKISLAQSRLHAITSGGATPFLFRSNFFPGSLPYVLLLASRHHCRRDVFQGSWALAHSNSRFQVAPGVPSPVPVPRPPFAGETQALFLHHPVFGFAPPVVLVPPLLAVNRPPIAARVGHFPVFVWVPPSVPLNAARPASSLLRVPPFAVNRAAVGLSWRKSETAFFDKENWTPELSSDQKSKRRLEKFSKDEPEKPRSGSNKENLTPDASRALKSRKSLSRSHTEIERQIMKKRVERVPFQSLLENSPMKASNSVRINQRDVNKAENSPLSCKLSNGISGDTGQSISTSKESVGHILKVVEDKKKWNIVVDTSCFVNEESRRSLQLLEGLKGTHLIIPIMVVRELDSMKRNSSETSPVPPTPPASPRLLWSEGNTELGGLTEILSPTAEDHILDCALLFKRIKTDGHLILLSKDTTLKIKAIAEGLLCETPAEFRESLVNPFFEEVLVG
ncbi:hypothetical protein J5N97_019977 [Dioscorea zingiberensis]|uniref:PIN domain-containing protein n=1 Tax=Dioscorea zingiberensis TaxID=325984 RepID=A0A9D5HDD4_9LILI|nr:hypothetical protein J5N97_019977 [Dioscorea zingiberensis]